MIEERPAPKLSRENSQPVCVAAPKAVEIPRWIQLMHESRERGRQERELRDEVAERQREEELLLKQEQAWAEGVPWGSRWVMYILERSHAPRSTLPDRMVLFERKPPTEVSRLEEREFRIWSDFLAEDRWDFREAQVEGRTLFPFDLEVPLRPRVGEAWGSRFVLVHGPSEIDGQDVQRLEGILAKGFSG